MREESRLAKHLRPDEGVLWQGKPVKAPFLFTGLIAIPLGLVFLGFSIFWMWEATSAGAPGPFTLFGLPFVLIGLGLTVGPQIWQLMRYRNTEYMITDQRVIIQTGAVGLDTKFIDLDKIQEVYVTVGFVDRIFGTGTLFAVTAGSAAFGAWVYTHRGSAGGGPMPPHIASVREPYEVQRALQVAVEKARPTRTD